MRFLQPSSGGAGGTTITGSGTSGQVAFFNGTQTITSDSGFLYASGAGTLTTSLTTPLVYGGTSSGGNLILDATSNATSGYVGITNSPRATANFGTLSIGGGAFDGTTTGYFVGSTSGTSLAINEASGFAGNLADFQIAGVSKFKITSTIITPLSMSVGPYVLFNNTFGTRIQNSSSGLGFYSSSAVTGFDFQGGSTTAWGAVNTMNIVETYAPNSASATGGYIGINLVPTINQTGGAAAITRGLYINPTLTAAADYRAFESANGRVLITNTPTASANYGSFSLGGGAFDGSTSGYFVGSSSGTSLAINEASGYTGDLANFQIAGVSKFKVTNAGSIYASTIVLNGYATISNPTNSSLVFAIPVNSGTVTSYLFQGNGGSASATSGTLNFMSLGTSSNFAPTSGTAVYNALNLTTTINQTGGASGITRGLYINPTLTSVANFRAIEVAVGITLLATYAFASLPTGIPTGAEVNISDSTTTTWGATIAGGGANNVKARYNGTNWTVVGI